MQLKIYEEERFKKLKNLGNHKLKLVYAFKYRNTKYPYEFSKRSNFIVVYENDECYGFGKNKLGCLGKTHEDYMNKELEVPVKIDRLCEVQIKNFYNGSYHMIALTEDDKIYCWGSNYYGQLGLNFDETKEFDPYLNKYLSDKKIVDIKCGDRHSLALSKDGTVYAWGDNKIGQIGKKTQANRDFEPKPLKLNEEFKINVKVIAIACGSMHSMALCENNEVYSWGYNKFGQCGFENPINNKVIEIIAPIQELKLRMPIIKICCGRKSSYLIVSNDNKNLLYYCGQSYLESGNVYLPKVFNGRHFDDISTIISGELIALVNKQKKICYFGNEYDYKWFNLKKPQNLNLDPIKETLDLKDFNEFFDEKFQITFGTLTLEHKGINDGMKSDIQDLNEENTSSTQSISKDKYSNEYEEIEPLGEGSFGSVFKVKNISDGQYFAIKKINLQGKTEKQAQMFLNEMLLSSGFDNDYIVKTYTPWIENNIIFIPMEVCYDTLENIINEKPKQLFNRKLSNGEIMSLTEFFITSELFKEILNGVNYLHDQGIMHRDLKPPNIFISSGLNGKFIKIGDFGLAKCLNIEGEFIKSHTKMMVGTAKYCAPEVLQNQSHYGSLRDIYSLGVIVEELYDIHKEPELTESTLLAQKYKSIFDCKEKMLMRIPEKRPTCAALLEDSAKWCITHDDLKYDHQFNSLKNQIITISDIKSGFNLYFLKERLIDYING